MYVTACVAFRMDWLKIATIFNENPRDSWASAVDVHACTHFCQLAWGRHRRKSSEKYTDTVFEG